MHSENVHSERGLLATNITLSVETTAKMMEIYDPDGNEAFRIIIMFL